MNTKVTALCVAGALVAVVSPSARADQVSVTASALNIRSGPSSGYRVITTVRRGARLERLSTSGNWSRVKTGGRTGYAYSRYLKRVSGSTSSNGPTSSQSGTPYVVTASSLRVRSGAGTNYRQIGALSRGREVRVLASSGSWRRIAWSGTAWVHGAYLARKGSGGSTTPPPPTGNRPKSRAGFIQLPNSGYGFFGYYSSSRRWGTPTMVYGIERVARKFKQQNPGAPRLGVGDISIMNGGKFPGHASHQRGVDADFRPIKNNRTEGPVTIYQGTYSRTLTQKVFDLFVREVRVTHIFFNDRRTRHTQHWPNHANHFHVRIR